MSLERTRANTETWAGERGGGSEGQADKQTEGGRSERSALSPKHKPDKLATVVRPEYTLPSRRPPCRAFTLFSLRRMLTTSFAFCSLSLSLYIYIYVYMYPSRRLLFPPPRREQKLSRPFMPSARRGGPLSGGGSGASPARRVVRRPPRSGQALLGPGRGRGGGLFSFFTPARQVIKAWRICGGLLPRSGLTPGITCALQAGRLETVLP